MPVPTTSFAPTGGLLNSSPNKSMVPTNESVATPAQLATFKSQAAPAPVQSPAVSTSSSPGMYKGVNITPGTDTEIQAQIRAIDATHASTSMGAPAATTPPTAPPAASQTPSNTFSGITGGLIGAARQAPTVANQYAQQAAGYGAGSIPIAAQAKDIASQFGQKYADVGQQGARFQAGQLTTGTTPVAEGNAAITAQTTAAQQQALAEGESAALQGIGYGLTGQQQAAQAAEQAGGLATTGQGQQISGLTSAAGLAQPSTAAYGQTVFNPLTGQYESGGGLPADTLQQYAQMAANGQYAAIPSSITSNPVLSAQLNEAAKQINPNYNPVTSSAQGASAADLTGQASNIQASANGAEANFNLMQNIAAQGGVLDTNVPVLNTLQQNVARGLTSNAAVVNFQSLIQSVRSQYAVILGGGTSSVEALQEAQQLIPDNISLGALQSLGANLKSDAQNRVQGINQQIQSLTGGSGGGTPTGTPTGTSSGASGGSNFGWNG